MSTLTVVPTPEQDSGRNPNEETNDDGWDSDLSERFEEPARSGFIPPRLDRMRPGPVMAAYLSAIDVNDLSGYDRIVVMRAHQRMASHYQAQVYSDMAAVTDVLDKQGANWLETTDSAAAEIRAALHLTRTGADVELSFALDLKKRLPRLLDMLNSGLIDVRRARSIDRGTYHLPVETARRVFDRVAEAAPGLTSGELRARIQKLCIEADPDEAKERYKRAVAERRLVTDPTTDGTCNLRGLDLPADRAVAVSRRINRIARSLRVDGETRTMDQLRADVYLDLLSGAERKDSAGARGVMHLVVDVDTLAELTDHPGQLGEC